MRSEPRRAARTFATFRIVGDGLIPDDITKVLGLVPTQAYAKGQSYTAGPQGGELKGRTGLWYLSTDRLIASDRLATHLSALLYLIFGSPTQVEKWIEKLNQVKRLAERNSFRVVVTCFWDGPAGAKPPTVPRFLIETCKYINAEIVTDFDTDEDSTPDKRELATALD